MIDDAAGVLINGGNPTITALTLFVLLLVAAVIWIANTCKKMSDSAMEREREYLSTVNQGRERVAIALETILTKLEKLEDLIR